MAAIFSAVDVTGLTSGVSTILIGVIGVGLLFLGYKYAKRAMHTA